MIIRLIKERINWADNLPYYYKKLDYGQGLWQEFLKQRDDLIPRRIKYFFKTYYPDVIDLFYKNVPENQFELLIKQLIKEWINDGNLFPILPKFLQNQLGFLCIK